MVAKLFAQLGNVLGGFLGGVIGLHPTIWIGAIGGLFVFLPVLFSPVRGIREMPAPLDEDEGGDVTPASEVGEDGVLPPGHLPPVGSEED